MTDQPTERVASELVERIDEQPWSRWLADWEQEAAARFIQSELAAQQAAIVAMLHGKADKVRKQFPFSAGAYDTAADAIERGEHKEQSA